MRILAWVGVSIILGALGACAGGGGNGGFEQAVAASSSPLVVLDLVTGKVTYSADIVDLQANPKYRKEQIVFRRIRGGGTTLGAPATEGYAEIDEYDRNRKGTHSPGERMVAVFELTQAQYAILAGPAPGAAPWIQSNFLESGPAGDSKPAFGLSSELVKDLLRNYAARTGVRLRLPSADEWEDSCRAGSKALFSWGSQVEGALPEAQAVVRRSTAPPVLTSVGSLEPNAFGLFDMHGNVWELTSDVSGDVAGQAVICGGSWYQSSLQARCANRSAVPVSLGHPLVGARLILTP